MSVREIQGQLWREPLVTEQKTVAERKCRNRKPGYRLILEKNGRALGRAGQWEGREAGKYRFIPDVQDLIESMEW